MGFGDFWINHNENKEQLKDTRHVSKWQLDEKFHNLFDAFDTNGSGVLEEEELARILTRLSEFSGSDKTLDGKENIKARSIFKSEKNIENADFMGFIKSLSEASKEVLKFEKSKSKDGGEVIKTAYKNGIIETCYYYPDGELKYKTEEWDINLLIPAVYPEIQDGKYEYKHSDLSNSDYISENHQNLIANEPKTKNIYLSQRAEEQAEITDFVLSHYVETHLACQEALDTMGIFDEFGAAINAGAGEMWNSVKNKYNFALKGQAPTDYDNFYELCEKFKPNYEKASSLQSTINQCRINNEGYFADDIQINPEQGAKFKKTVELFQEVSVLKSKIECLKKAMNEIRMYQSEQEALTHAPEQSYGMNPAKHLENANNLLLEFCGGDTNAADMLLNGAIANPDLSAELIKGLLEDTEKMYKTRLGEKTFEEIKSDYMTQYKDIYKTDFVPEELTEKVMTAKGTGGMVKLAGVTIISLLISRSPVIANMMKASAGLDVEGAALIKTLVSRYGQTAVQQGIKFAMTSGTLAADVGLTLLNQATSERGVNGEELWESTKGSAKYIYFGAYIGTPLAQAVSKGLGEIGAGARLFNGGVKTTQGAITTTSITGDGLVRNLTNLGNKVLTKGGAFLTDVTAFAGLEMATEGQDILTAGQEQVEMLGKLKIMNHFIEYLLGGKVHAGISKARMDMAIEKSGIKNWKIEEIQTPNKTTCQVQIEGFPPLKFEDRNQLITFMLERVTSVYADFSAVKAEELKPSDETKPETKPEQSEVRPDAVSEIKFEARPEASTKAKSSEGAEGILTRLEAANDRETFAAIRDEIKKLPNSEEKTQLMQTYLQKYNEWTSASERPDIRMEYKPEVKSEVEAPKFEFRELTDAEFNELKPRIEAKLREKNIDVELTKENIQLAEMIFSDEKLCNNENVMNYIGDIIRYTRTPEIAKAKAEIMKLYCSDEKLYNDETIKDKIGDIIKIIKTPEIAEIAKTILADRQFYKYRTTIQYVVDLIYHICTPEQAEIAKIILTDKKFYYNKNVSHNIGRIIPYTYTPEQTEIAKMLLSDEKLYNDENVMNMIAGILPYTKTPEKAEIVKRILADEKLYNDKNLLKNINDILYDITPEQTEIVKRILADEKLYNNKNVMKNIKNIIRSTNTPESAKVKIAIMDFFCSNENLNNCIGDILRIVQQENAPLAKQLCQTEGLNTKKTIEILESVKLTDVFNAGEIDTQKVRRYTSLLQDKKLSPFVVEHLNNGMDMNTVAFLAKTQIKINAENAPNEVKPQTNDALQASYNVFTSHGMGDKEASAIVKAISEDGVPDIALQSVALDLLNKGVPANKIGDVIKNAKITGEFNQKILDDFVSLQNLKLHPLLEKNLAVLNNISGTDTAVKFNSNIKKQIKALLERLTPEQSQALAERGFDTDTIKQKLDVTIKRTSANVYAKVQGYRTKQSLTGFEKIVVDKYNPDQMIWQNEQATRAWAEDKYNSIMGGDYKSRRDVLVNEPREKGLKEWADFMANDAELKDNPFAKIILAEAITKDLLPENSVTPPPLDKALIKEILASAADSHRTNISELYMEKLREKALKSTQSQEVEVNGVKGRWYTVPQTDETSADYKTNVNKVRAFSDGTNWCIRTYKAEPYVEEGAMHFFVDENGLTQVCIRETAKNSVYEIQKRQQNATVPVVYIDVIDDYMNDNGLKAQDECKAKIETARRAKPEFDKLKAEFTELVKNKDYKSILRKIGITVKENSDGTLILSHYNPEMNGFTLSDLGIKENDLLENVIKIEGDAKFKNSNATAAPRLQEVGGKFDFEDSNLSDVRSLKSINGKEINWHIPELQLNTPAKSMILKSGDKVYLKPELEAQIRSIAEQIHETALDNENDIVKFMKECGFEVSGSKMYHRAKRSQSLYDKLKNYLTDKDNADRTLNDAIKDVRDAIGTRTVLKNKDYTKHPEVAALLNAGKKREAVLRAAELQSQEMFENLKTFLIKQKENNTEIRAVRVNNYMANDGVPYLSERQLAELQDLGVVSIKSRITPNDEKAELFDFDNKDASTKVRESGYTAFQMNFVTKEGFVYEWQFRGEEVNRFAEGEHIPYDLRTDKDLSSGNKDLELLYQPIKDLLDKDKMGEDVFNAYNKYLTAHYNYLRQKELGFDAQKPNLEDFGNFDKRLRAENLETLHDIASKLKDGKISADEAVKQYESCII